MPFVFAPDEQDGQDGDPPLDRYHYIPPPRFGGAPEPVHFSFEPPGPEVEPEPPPPVEPMPPPVELAPPAPAPLQRRSLLDVLLGRRRPAASPRLTVTAHLSYALVPQSRQPQREPAQRRQHLFAVAIPELRKAGVRRVYCRYDGGHDEGFAWPDYFDMQDGGRISPRDLAGRLRGAGLADRLSAAGAMNLDAFTETDLDVLRRLCFEWASLLLGDGYGTGEYSMYGAFMVDLDACTISDDRVADPGGDRASKFGR
jgi:hypothetical protein